MRMLATFSALVPLVAAPAASCSANDAIPGAAALAPAEAKAEAAEDETQQPDGVVPDGVALSVDAAAPYFRSGPAAQAFEAFRLERWREAQRGFAELLAAEDAPTDEAVRARMRLLEGLASAELDDWPRAADALESARRDLPLLEDFIAYHAARAHYFARNLDEAKKLAREVAPKSIVGTDAALLLGDVLRARGDHEAVASHYGAYLEDRERGTRRAEARFRLAEAREAMGERDTETLEHYRRIAIHAPLSEWAEPASERMLAILTALPEAAREPYEDLSGHEHFARGMAYYRSMRNERAAADLAAALDSGELDTDERCEAAYYRGHAWFRARDRRKSAPRLDEAYDLCRAADNEDLSVRAAYVAGRSYAMLREPETSIARHELVEKHFPDHSFADDARLRQAEQYENLGEDDKVVELLSTLPELYPDDDMRGEALWRLAWRAFKAEDYEDAIGWLEKHIEAEPIAQNYWAEGQAQYWMGRAHAELGDDEAAVAAYRSAVLTYPLTYYALLSLNRLRESHESEFRALVDEIRREPEDLDPDAPAFSFEPRTIYDEPGFRRGLELLRLGLGDSAAAEFRRLGLSPPSHRRAIESPDQAEMLWAMAFLYDRAGQYPTSHWPTRWHLVEYKRSWPVGKHRARWRIAYPNAFWDLLDRHASNHSYPTALQIALVREESAFDPLIESWANAVGLTQLIMPTARRFARGTGVEVSRETLRDPDTNAMIGARFLDFLHERYDGHPMLMIPAYNAGEGAVDRWLRRRGELPADAWIEEIRVDQPRRYTKRLLGSYFAYAYLNEGRIPELPNELPR